MSNENPNNTPHWRNKLDDLERLPGSTFHANAAWDKLHGRLQGDKKSKKIHWYWIAAACLVFGLIIMILNFQKTTPPILNRETVKEQPKEIKKPVLKLQEASKNEIDNIPGSVKDKIVTTSNQPAQRNRRIVPTEVAKVQSNDTMANYPEQEPVAKSLQIVNNNSTAATAPPKKKLNVVHINELGDPVIEVPDMASKMGKHSFKLANEEVYVNPTVYKNTDFTILKTKL